MQSMVHMLTCMIWQWNYGSQRCNEYPKCMHLKQAAAYLAVLHGWRHWRPYWRCCSEGFWMNKVTTPCLLRISHKQPCRFIGMNV